MEDDQFPFNDQFYEEGIEIPEEISGWFPPIQSQGKLSSEAYKKILEENPEPNRGLLKPQKLDRYLRAILSKDIIKRDDALAALQADTGRNLRPIICISTGQGNEVLHRKCKQAILLAINTMAKITIQRKTSILRALKTDEADIRFWCQEHSTSREWLFGEEFHQELEAKQQRQFHQSITKMVYDKACTFSQDNATNVAKNDPPRSIQGYASGNPPRGRGRGRGYHPRIPNPSTDAPTSQ